MAGQVVTAGPEAQATEAVTFRPGSGPTITTSIVPSAVRASENNNVMGGGNNNGKGSGGEADKLSAGVRVQAGLGICVLLAALVL